MQNKVIMASYWLYLFTRGKMKLSKKYTIYLMQHSHTDIGYTKSPEHTLIEQVEFIKFLVKNFQDVINDDNHKWKNYKWVCESFIIVEKFVNEASDEEVKQFIELVKIGKIEVTGMYANIAEVLDSKILSNMIKGVKEFGEKHEINIQTAMNADVNGLSRDYARALVDNGIENYFSCVHTHHGMYPLFKKQQPFIWDLGNGQKLNVWNGEHYMFGNGFGFAKGAISVHGFFDDVDFKKYNLADDDSWIEMAEKRFEKYINQLEKDEYNYDFIPLTIHGKFTDNSMPNMDISIRVDKWNEKHGDKLEVKMVTLSEFFKVLNKQADIPVYDGEWPDWWTDGVISAPAQLKLFKNAQHRYNALKQIEHNGLDTTKLEKKIEYNLTMYAEHTYGSFDSISNPYHSFTHKQWTLKQNYLSNALRYIDEFEHHILSLHGNDITNFKLPNFFKVINPNEYSVKKQFILPYQDCDANSLTGTYEITDNINHKYEYAVTNDWRKLPIIQVEMEPKQELIIESKVLDMQIEEIPYFSRYNLRGSDNVFDLGFMNDGLADVTENSITTNDLQIKWSQHGVTSIIKGGEEILNGEAGLLTPIYELSQVARHTLGRNRKGTDVVRAHSKVLETKIIERTKLYSIVEQKYEVSGFDKYVMYFKLYADGSQLEVKINCDKHLSSAIENVYLNIPMDSEELIISKTNDVFKPWNEQLPGTLTDYYSVFEGVKFNNGLVMATPDVQLLQLGTLQACNRILYGEEKLSKEAKKPYIWLMSNYWETNFVKSLAGFYEFNFSLSFDNESIHAIDDIKSLSSEIFVFPINE